MYYLLHNHIYLIEVNLNIKRDIFIYTMNKKKLKEGEEPQHVAQALPQTKEKKQVPIGEKLMEYFQEIGLKHSFYQNENGDIKIIGLNKDQVKEAIHKIVDNWKIKSEIALPAGVGLNLPGGSINGAPSEDDVEKMKSKLGTTESIDTRGKALLMTFNDIVKNHSALKVKDYGKTTLVDVQSANVILKLYDALSDKNKESLIKMPVPKMIQMAWHVMGKK